MIFPDQYGGEVKEVAGGKVRRGRGCMVIVGDEIVEVESID